MITFAYNDNAGGDDKSLHITCDVPCFEWVIWGTREDFAKALAFVRTGGDYLKVCESNGKMIYWSMEDGSLWVLLGDLESWDFGMRLSDEERDDLIEKLSQGPE